MRGLTSACFIDKGTIPLASEVFITVVITGISSSIQSLKREAGIGSSSQDVLCILLISSLTDASDTE